MARFAYPRLPDWTERWSLFIKDCIPLTPDLALDWEYVTCTSFSAQGIEAITGHNPFDEGDWAGKFANPLGALKEIKSRGFETLDDVIADLFPEIPLSMAHPGDVILLKAPDWSGDERLMSVMPHGVGLADPPAYYATTREGLGRGDLYQEAVRAFAVGREV